MGTNDEGAAAVLKLPNTVHELSALAPESIIMRVVCRSLVTPRDCRSTHRWVSAQVPRVICKLLLHKVLDTDYRHYDRASVTGQHLAAWLRLPRSDAHSDGAPPTPSPAMDLTVCEAYACAVAGACLGLALQHAGTSDRATRDVLIQRVWSSACDVVA